MSLFYNSAIPIKVLFRFFAIAGNPFLWFKRIPSLFKGFENINALRIENKKAEDV